MPRPRHPGEVEGCQLGEAGFAWPADTTVGELGYRPQPATRWLCPTQLFRTGVQAALASVLGGYSDRRETMAVFDNPVLDLSADGPGAAARWIDYVADTGDGWGATMSVLDLAARPRLSVAPGDGRPPASTPRGSVLVLGGDLVYPTASERAYEDRLTGPMRSAWAWTEGPPPTVLALPGNHDWYDGLTAFLRVFSPGRWLGAWRTAQSRSYFAARLSGGWWLWGVDIQLSGYVDRAQLEWFQDVSRQLPPGTPVLLCTAKPSWVHTHWGEGDVDAFVTTDFFLRNTLGAVGAEVRVALSGDLHHYARYESADGAQLITAGTGGAFLHGTSDLPARLEVPPLESRDPGRSPTETFTLAAAYPDAATSRRLAREVARLPFRNGGLPVLVGGAYVGLTSLLGVSSDPLGSAAEIAGRYVRSPLALFLTVLVGVALRQLTKSRRPVLAWGIGLGHTATHVVLALAVAGVAGSAVAPWLDGGPLGVAAGGVALVAAVGVLGGLAGCWALALWLWLGWRLFGLNANELYSATRNEGHKGLLRLCIADDGTLTIYPIMLERTCPARRWRLRPRPPGPGADEPWFAPVDELVPRLVDGPVTVRPRTRGADDAAP